MLIQLSLKIPHQDVPVETTAFEGMQIFNAAFLQHIFVDNDWERLRWRANARGYWRTDDLLDALPGRVVRGAYAGTVDKNVQHLFLPLRETLRKFNGYSGAWVNGSAALHPPLRLPPSRNTYVESPEALRRSLDALAGGSNRQLTLPDGKAAVLPREWKEASVRMHRAWPYPFGERVTEVRDDCCALGAGGG